MSGMPLEFLVIQLLNEALESEFYASVPADRPSRFGVVSRVGGPKEYVTERGRFAIDIWDTTRYEAGLFADDVARRLRPILLAHPRIAKVSISSVVFFPDPNSNSPRYQLLAEITAVE